MDIQQLKYFSRVYELANYAHAAEQLYISRQALRKSVMKLEGEVGQILFTNGNNKLIPTDAAHRLYSFSRPALKSFSDLERLAFQLRLEKSGYISFGEACGANDVFTKDELRMFSGIEASKGPINTNLRMIEGSCTEIRAMILSGELSYANIVCTSVNESLFDYEIAREGQIYLAMRNDDPLAQQETVSIPDLKGRVFSTQGPGYDVHNLIAARAQDLGFSLVIGDVRGALGDRLRTVEAGLDITYAFQPSGFSKIASHVTYRPFSESSMRWMLCTIAKKGLGDRQMLRYFAGKKLDMSNSDFSQGVVDTHSAD